MAYEAKNFKFSADILEKSAGNFKAFVKERYADIPTKVLGQLVKKFYGKDVILEEDGNDSGVSKKAVKDSEQGGDWKDSFWWDKEVWKCLCQFTKETINKRIYFNGLSVSISPVKILNWLNNKAYK